MRSQSRTKILIASNDDTYLDCARKTLSRDKFEIKIADTLDDAIQYLKAKYSLNGIFVDPDLGNSGLKLLKLCHNNQTSVPIYLMGKSLVELSKQITAVQIGIQGFVKTEQELEQAAIIIDEKMSSFDTAAVIEAGKSMASEDESHEDSRYSAIRAVNFLSGSTCLFDVFVRIRKEKFVKLLNVGDVFEPERLNKYLRKGLEHLFIRKGAQKVYVDFCNKLTKKIISSEEIKDEIKISQTLGHGEEVFKTLLEQGVDGETLAYAKDYAHNVNELLDKIAHNNGAIASFSKNVALYEHCTGTAVIACLLGKNLGLETADSVETLGLACVLHDIGLFQLSNPYDDDINYKYLDGQFILDELKKGGLAQKRKKELQRIYNYHAEVGADLVTNLLGIKEVVPQIIRQHHLRIDNTGLGQPVKAGDFNPLSQIVAVADEYSRLLKLVAKFKVSEEEIMKFPSKLAGFSGSIQRLFHDTFTNNL